SFSGGKDSTVMLHMVMDEAIKRGRVVGVLIIDLEAQYKITMQHVFEMLALYADYIDLFWVCLPMLLRNAVTQFEPRWCCWEPEAKNIWVRDIPTSPITGSVISDPAYFSFFEPHMEF